MAQPKRVIEKEYIQTMKKDIALIKSGKKIDIFSFPMVKPVKQIKVVPRKVDEEKEIKTKQTPSKDSFPVPSLSPVKKEPVFKKAVKKEEVKKEERISEKRLLDNSEKKLLKEIEELKRLISDLFAEESLLQKEIRKIEEIEKEEKTGGTFLQSQKIKEKKEQIEARRREIQRNINSLNKKIDESQNRLRALVSRKSDLEQKRVLETGKKGSVLPSLPVKGVQKTKDEDFIQKLKEKRNEIIRLLEDSKNREKELVNEDRDLDLKMKRVLEQEKKIEEQERITEEKERKTIKAQQKRKIEEERWKLQKERRKIEEEKWEIQKEKANIKNYLEKEKGYIASFINQKQKIEEKIREAEKESFYPKKEEGQEQSLPTASSASLPPQKEEKQSDEVQKPEEEVKVQSKQPSSSLEEQIKEKLEKKEQGLDSLEAAKRRLEQFKKDISSGEKSISLSSLEKEGSESEEKEPGFTEKEKSFSRLEQKRKELFLGKTSFDDNKKNLSFSKKKPISPLPSPIPPSGSSSQEPPQKPSFIKRFSFKILVIVLLVVLLGFSATFIYWFFAVRKETQPALSPSPLPAVDVFQCKTNDDCKAGEICTEEGKCVEKEIEVNEAYLSFKETKEIEVTADFSIFESLFAENSLWDKKGEFKRLVLINKDKKEELNLKEFLTALYIDFPDDFYNNTIGYNIFIYSQEQGGRLGVIIKILDKEKMSLFLKEREEKMKDEFISFISTMEAGELVKASGFKDASRVRGYESFDFRYFTISKNDLGICYFVSDEYLVFGSSFESMKEVIKAIENLEE